LIKRFFKAVVEGRRPEITAGHQKIYQGGETLKTKRKVLSILITMSMLLVLLVPLAAPASAYSVNRASKIVSIADDFNGDTGVNFELKEDTKWVADFVYGDVFQLILTDGVNWNAGATALEASQNGVCATAEIVSDQILEITFTEDVDPALVNSVVVPMDIEVDGASTGDITVEVDPIDSGVSAGTYVFARISGDTTNCKALSVETIGDPGVGGDIRIEEASLGSLGWDAQYIKFKLPSDFNWNGPVVSFSGGFSGMVAGNGTIAGTYKATVTDNVLMLDFTPAAADRTTRGMITVSTPINPTKDADYGDVEVSITGDVAEDCDLVVAKYADYGVDVTVDEVKDIKAGKYDQELDTITIEENVTGTLIDGRDFTLVFPEWVKITCAEVKDTNITVEPGDVDGTDNELDISVLESSTGDATGKIDLDLKISVEGNKGGQDIEMTIDGSKAGIPEDTSLVVGKAVALVTATADATKDVKIGVQAQEIGTIDITELVKEAISDDPNGNIGASVKLSLPEGVWFSSKPAVKVTAGNLDIKKDGVSLVVAGDTTDGAVQIDIDNSGTKVSTIQLTGVKVTVDRTVPTGDLMLKVGGGAIIENQKANKEGWLCDAVAGAADTVDEGEFDTGTAVKIKIANIITPAPGDVSGTAVFTIGSTSYTINGIAKTMDVAPYIKGDRTFIPVRFVAQAAGVADNNIIWNAADQSVVLIKGDRVVKLVIGSNQLLINGMALTMDVAPEIVDPGRTMLPLRAVTQALGCLVTWDAATQTATVSL
jgi:hypothetical protein